MNSLLLMPSERLGESEYVVVGERLQFIKQHHDLKVGQTIRVAELGGLRGTGTITECEAEALGVRVDLAEPPLERMPIDLIVGICRPQTIKKVIQIATSFGVRRLDFVRTERAEKSYLQSGVLSDTSIRSEIILALEQACDSHGPEVAVHPRFRPFVEDELARRRAGQELIVFHTQTSASAPEPKLTGAVSAAIGPEGGWNEFEINTFFKLGFKQATLGPRILRVEHAVAMCCGAYAIRNNV